MRLFLFTLIVTFSLAHAAERMIPHVTKVDVGDGFSTTVILANARDSAQTYELKLYDETGMLLATLEGTVPARQTVSRAQVVFFGEAAVSHFSIDRDIDLVVTLAYQANLEASGPAHVRMDGTLSKLWRFFPGNPEVTWDGLGVVNMGDVATDIQIFQRAADGSLIEAITAQEGLAPRAKLLYGIGSPFQVVEGSYYEVIASQEMALVALRGTTNGKVLFENRALPAEVDLSSLNYTFENAFPNLALDSLVDLQPGNDGTNRLFAVDQDGTIQVFDNDAATATSSTYLDISDRVTRDGEMGLLGLALHPDYGNTGYCYVNYTEGNPMRTVIARYPRIASGSADASNELRIMTIDQPSSNHNGGQLAFGPDGFLYISLGDGGGAGDPFGNGQNLTTRLATIMRIDVSGATPAQPFTIPADNPFAGNNDGYLEEIYAYGLRNAWRFSFDGTDLWAADVGQDNHEEINLIVSGGNYGWNVMEGNHCYSPPNGCDSTDLMVPVFEYDHSNNDKSVTGGFVYRGRRLPSLYGAYIYGDFASNRIWALRLNAEGNWVNSEIFNFWVSGLSSFGVDESGELYLCAYGGSVNRIVVSN